MILLGAETGGWHRVVALVIAPSDATLTSRIARLAVN